MLRLDSNAVALPDRLRFKSWLDQTEAEGLAWQSWVVEQAAINAEHLWRQQRRLQSRKLAQGAAP